MTTYSKRIQIGKFTIKVYTMHWRNWWYMHIDIGPLCITWEVDK